MIFEDIAAHGVVPVIALDDAAAALPLADALIAGGLPVAEITFRTAAARDTIAAIAAHRPEVLIGAGTVLVEDQVDAALAAGARFALSPGLDAAVLAAYGWSDLLPLLRIAHGNDAPPTLSTTAADDAAAASAVRNASTSTT